jgi:hypothetical protein
VAFWDWFRGRPKAVEVADDAIWLTAEAKFCRLCTQTGDGLRGAHFALVVAYFPQTLDRVREELGRQGVPHAAGPARLSTNDILRGAEPRALLALAESLPVAPPADSVDDGGPVLPVLIAERHFLRAADERILDFARGLGRRCRVRFHLSLQDPLLRIFAGEWVGGLLTQLGMTEDKPLESPMVARRLRAAQDLVARRAVTDRAAASAEEWLALNVPEMSPPGK